MLSISLNDGGEGANWPNADFHTFFLRGGGHFAGMPTVADKRWGGVKNRENLPTS